MRVRNLLSTVGITFILFPTLALAQSGPMATAFRDNAIESGRKLAAAADAMPADKYTFHPTAAQQSFAELLVHAAQANDYLCSTISGTSAPTRGKIAASDSKAALVARLRETLSYCEQALAKVDDSTLGEQLPFLRGHSSRAAVMVHAVADWESHYSQAASYLRLNGLTPPKVK